MTSAYPRLATPGDIPRLISGDGVHHTWPPPGTVVVPVGHPEPFGLVVGDTSALTPGDWYVTSLAEFVLDVPTLAVGILARAAAAFTGPIATFAGVVGHWPVIYEVGAGEIMRWISSTFRGTLGGGVEQFQFKLDWGNPGNDPTLSEADALVLAQQLGGLMATAFNTGTNAVLKLCAPDVQFTEVGVVEKTQTSATNADGSGGNLEQSYGTAWWAWPGITGPKGSATGNSLPWEVSCAVTLQTDTRGPRGRGRIYLPPFAVLAMASGGKWFAALPNDLSAQVGAFFTAVKAGTPYKPVVVSRRALQLHEITSVNCGIIPDSQRRRRRSQDEARQTGWTKP